MTTEMLWIAVGNIGRWMIELSGRKLDMIYQPRPLSEQIRETYL